MDVSVQALRKRYLRHSLGLVWLSLPAAYASLQFHLLGLRYLVLKRVGSHGLGTLLTRNILIRHIHLVVVIAADETHSGPRTLLVPTGLAHDRRLL